ncbi:MAG: ATP-dependent 6-phosphofructokinase [Candidatus Omnitrophica bacterium]|nr:ATP-dependent 6-phosphofructokinase [Candidatus Omnitrophota bacterium]
MKSAVKRIGLLTAGGDCPGLNAVIRSVVKTAINDHALEVMGIEDGYYGLIHNKMINLKYSNASGILNLGGTILGTSNIDNPFRFQVETKKGFEYKDVSDKAVDNYRKEGLDCLICVGGDGTLNIAQKLFKKGLNVIGVPKTIDNDLNATDLTFGFDSAVQTITEAIDKLHTTAQSHHRVMVLETMGRYAGWLALSGGIAGGGDIILIPEIPYDINKVCEKVKERNRLGKRFSIVVVAEGARPKGGRMVVNKVDKRSTDPIRLGGIGNLIAQQIGKLTGIDSRTTVLGHLQRGGSPTAFDRILATRFGREAVKLAVKGKFGHMVSLRGEDITAVKIKDAIKKLRKVSPSSHLIACARSLGVSFGN